LKRKQAAAVNASSLFNTNAKGAERMVLEGLPPALTIRRRQMRFEVGRVKNSGQTLERE
jgi:hypothetical protein